MQIKLPTTLYMTLVIVTAADVETDRVDLYKSYVFCLMILQFF